MRQIVQTLTTVGQSAAVPVDTYITPFQLSTATVMVGNTYAECTIQYTFDNVLNPSVTPTWWDATTEADEANDEGFLLTESGVRILQENGGSIVISDEKMHKFIDFPVAAVRVDVTQLSAGGSVLFTVLQSGMSGQ
jgi:hypothetical protein